MRHHTQDTSRDAYEGLRDRLAASDREYYDLLQAKSAGLTDNEFKRLFKRELPWITSRRNRCMAKGLVENPRRTPYGNERVRVTSDGTRKLERLDGVTHHWCLVWATCSPRPQAQQQFTFDTTPRAGAEQRSEPCLMT